MWIHPRNVCLILLATLTLPMILGRCWPRFAIRPRTLLPAWLLLGIFTVSELISPLPAIWMLALLSFYALKEYLSLVDLRIEDRLGVLGCYLCIPFTFYLVQIDWYGFFIVSIPVYAFVIIPFLVAWKSRRSSGSVFSIGALNLGLFLFVYCLGHLAYLMRISTWLVLILLVGVSFCEWVFHLKISWKHPCNAMGKLLLPVAGCSAVVLATLHQVQGEKWPFLGLALLLPVLVGLGDFTLSTLEKDLGIDPDKLEPGRGYLLHGLRSLLFSAPVVFHYLRFFSDLY